MSELQEDIVTILRGMPDLDREERDRAADEIERLRRTAALTDGEMVRWLTEQVKERDNVIESMKGAAFDQITKAFVGATLTETEREAVEWARCMANMHGLENAAATLLGLLERHRALHNTSGDA